MALTKRQREVLDYIQAFIDEHRYSPSLEEIAAGVGCSSIATVHKHLANLETKGAIRRAPNRSRSIEPGDPDGAGIAAPRAVEVPMLGAVAAGRPIEAVRDDEDLAVPEALLRGRETFALRVRGDSMIGELIGDGDIILVERTETAENGEMVVALVDGTDVTVKKFYGVGGHAIRLEPANEDVEPITVPADRVKIHGRVIGLLRKY